MSLNLPNTPIQPFNVLGVDPGGTTGWAHSWLSQDLIDAGNIDYGNVIMEDIALVTGELGPEPHYEELHTLLVHAAHDASVSFLPPPEIVSEPFHFRQHKDNPRQGLELVSCEYIGVIRLACAQLGLTYYDRFTPGESKRYVTDTKLDLLGWLQKPVTPMRHRNDALRQLVKYLIVKKQVRHPITSAWKRET